MLDRSAAKRSSIPKRSYKIRAWDHGTGIAFRDVSSRSALFVFFGVLLAASTLGAAEEDATRAARCPAYAEHVRAAKTYLEHSDRANAAAGLRLAEDALRECDFDDEEETALASADVTGLPFHEPREVYVAFGERTFLRVIDPPVKGRA
jgi:hypothetical protein